MSNKAERQRERRAQDRQEQQERERAVILHERILPMDRLGVSAGAIAAALLTKGIKGYDHRKVTEAIAEEQAHPTSNPNAVESVYSPEEALAALADKSVLYKGRLYIEVAERSKTITDDEGVEDFFDEEGQLVQTQKYDVGGYDHTGPHPKGYVPPKPTVVPLTIRLNDMRSVLAALGQPAEPKQAESEGTFDKMRREVMLPRDWRGVLATIRQDWHVDAACEEIVKRLAELTKLDVYAALDKLSEPGVTAQDKRNAKFLVRCLVNELAIQQQVNRNLERGS